MIGVISPSSSPDGMPGHRVAKHPLRYVSAKLQPNLLFGPIAPQFQPTLLPQLGSIDGPQDLVSFGVPEPILGCVFSGRQYSPSIFATISYHRFSVCQKNARTRLKHCFRDRVKTLFVVFRVVSHPRLSDGFEIDDA
jgi:hypothetical protein